ncbi:von willebrand factor [Colletotrichum chrysophilum]|uniref:von willebrand factor n=1 Tax=Colletotrichum chrysophilum TaxID=1836956 RepID=A0AAD9EIJ7_9PEZI|nr:von willebrand factor [Colletotrichum chrysophilum]
MGPFHRIIPRGYAPLRNQTRQASRPSPALITVYAVTTTRPIGLNTRMITSSTSQSKLKPASQEADRVEAEVTRASVNQQQQILPGEDHCQHHPTESTSPAPENTTSNPQAESSSTNNSSGSSQPHSHSHLALPPLPEARSNAESITLDLGGQVGGGASTKLDHLGPLVVHQDGTMSRIKNWGEMTKIERESTMRIIGRRNQTRLASLRDCVDSDRKERPRAAATRDDEN